MTTTTLTGEFELASWDENTYLDLEGEGKLTRASVAQHFSGDLEGEGTVEWLMCYAEDGTARFVGMQHVQGTAGDRKGSVVFQTVGAFDGAKAVGTWSVVPGSATGDMSGITGEGRFEAPHGPKATYTIEADLA